MWKRTLGALGFGSLSLYVIKVSVNQGNRTAVHCDPAEVSTAEELSTDNMTLRSVQVFFRHGARTPVRQIPHIEEVDYDVNWLQRRLHYADYPIKIQSLDGGPQPYQLYEEKYNKIILKGGAKAGGMTTLGEDQSISLGHRIKRKYMHKHGLINDSYDPENIKVRSTNFNRCIRTAQCVLAGMFGANHLKEKGPIKISVCPVEQEILIPDTFYCPGLKENIKKVQRHFSDIPKVMEVNEKINAVTGTKEMLELVMWNDHMTTRRAHGLHIPDYMKQIRPDLEEAATNMMVAFKCGFPSDRKSVLRLTVGSIYHLIQHNMHKTQIKDVSPRLYLFGCHDVTLIPMLMAVKAFDHKWPNYCSDLAFELWQDKAGQHWVKMVYCDKDLVPEGQSNSLMKFEDFQGLIAPIAIDRATYVRECASLAKILKDSSNTEVQDTDQQGV